VLDPVQRAAGDVPRVHRDSRRAFATRADEACVRADLTDETGTEPFQSSNHLARRHGRSLGGGNNLSTRLYETISKPTLAPASASASTGVTWKTTPTSLRDNCLCTTNGWICAPLRAVLRPAGTR